MPIRLPVLDDRDYATLAKEGIALIPAYSTEWTNHNASDPGITFLELFAYLTDIFLYRLDRVSVANRLAFLKLLTGKDAKPVATAHFDPDKLEPQLREASAGIRACTRAVTCEDHETIARMYPRHESGLSVARTKCFARRDFERQSDSERYRDEPGHTSVVVVPDDPWRDNVKLHAFCTGIRGFFEPRRLLTARIHVVAPRYVDVSVRIRCSVLPGAPTAKIRTLIEQQVNRWFHPLTGGPDATGWPFGGTVLASDLYRIVKGIHGVAVVQELDVQVADEKRVRRDESGMLTEVLLRPDELVRIAISDVAFDASGGKR